MKYQMIVAALVSATVTVSAFADPNPSNSQIPSTALESDTTPAVTQDGRGGAAYGQPVVGKTRAQVYQELVRAK